jgi:hypothetical protein
MSPFKGFENAKITFYIANGDYSVNAVGNSIARTKSLTITALLKQSKSFNGQYAQEIQNFAGADGYVFLLEGYLVDPMVYPEEIQFMMEGEAEIELSINMPKNGIFKLLTVIQSPFLTAASIDLVTPIKGLFRI